MSRRIDIELTSALADGSWTWRAAGARQPKGVVEGSVLPSGSKVGDVLKVEVDQEIDGISITSIVHGREKPARTDVLELLPVEREFQPVVETRAPRGRDDRRPRRDGDRRPRRDAPDGARKPPRDRDSRGKDDRRRSDAGDGATPRDRRRDAPRRGPSFTPPPEVPQRPKPKRLRPGKAHRTAVLANLPDEQRPIAELALQGMAAVRQRLKDDNAKAAAEGRAPMPEASVIKIAEELLPKLRVAEWLDRAEAAQAQVATLDLRDLRSVVAASDDPMVARDESTRELSDSLKAALAAKQESELQLWYGDVDAALAVGRVIRALRLSSQPPKAGVPFPPDIAQRLVDSTNSSLTPMDSAERWAAMLEAAAFSPIRSLVRPARRPDVVNDELLATVKRLGPALPQVAALFEVEVKPGAAMPKPLRPNPRSRDEAKKPAPQKREPREPRGPKGPKAPAGERAEAVQPGTVHATVEPETVEPETVHTEAVEPEPVQATVEPETVHATVAVETVEPETVHTEAVEPEPVQATVEPETVHATVAVETVEPETVEPETVAPETVAVEAEAVSAETVQPDAVEPDPVVVDAANVED